MFNRNCPAFKIAIIYLLISILWILVSDEILKSITSNIDIINLMQSVKGIAFVVFTAFIIYFLVKNDFKKEVTLRKRFEDVFNLSNIPTVIFNGKGESLYLNDCWCELTGYTKEEINTFEKFSKLLFKDKAEEISMHFISNLDKSERVNLGEFEVFTKDNRKLTWNFYHLLFEIRNGEKVYIGTAIDLTELRTSEALLIQQTKLATMGEMIGNIAHQWKQPLTSISAASGLIRLSQQFPELNDKFEKSLDDIDSSVTNLATTIDDFRNFFSPNKKITTFDVKKLIKKTLNLIKSQFVNNNIEIVDSVDEIVLCGYENELLQVLINIIKNAKEELIKLDINENRVLFIEAKSKNNNLNILIKDNAGGIPEGIIDKIFDNYFSTKGRDGTGIGLYMSKQIIEYSMKGTIKAYNKEFTYNEKLYKGAVFDILIPLSIKEEINFCNLS